jgi:hypothetical protein
MELEGKFRPTDDKNDVNSANYFPQQKQAFGLYKTHKP